MRTFRLVSALALGAGLPGASLTAAAQGAQRQPTQIPIALATALLAPPFGMGSNATHIVVGTAPEGIAAANLPPKPVSVLGGMTYGESREVVFVYPATDPDPAGSYMKLLEAAGWTRPQMEFARSGFVGPGELYVRPASLCHDSSRVTVLAVPGAPSGSTWVRANFSAERGINVCTRRPRADVMQEFVFPALEAPAGARTLGTSGGGGSFDTREISTTLQTTLTPSQLLAHYAAQLQKSGWTVGTALGGDSISVQRVSARDTKGQEWSGALSVIGVGTGWHVTVQMVKRAGS